MKLIAPRFTLFYILKIHTLNSTFIYFNTVFYIYKSKHYHPFFCIPTLIYYIVTLLLPKIPRKLGITLIFTTAFLLKTIAYFIDDIFDSSIQTCIVFILINVMVAFVDRFLKGIDVNEKCTGVYVLIDEAPNYIFALIFGVVEKIFGNKMWPYMLIVSFIYIVCGVSLCYIGYKANSLDLDRNHAVHHHTENIKKLNNHASGTEMHKTSLKNHIKTIHINKSNNSIESSFINERDNDINKLYINERDKNNRSTFIKECDIDISGNTIHKTDYLMFNSQLNIITPDTDIYYLRNKAFYKLIDKSSWLTYFITRDNPLQALILYLTKTICTITDIMVYFFLVTKMSEQSSLIIYFSFDFLFKAIEIDIPNSLFYIFVVAKFALLLSTIVSAILFFYGHYVLLLIVFFVNGLTNQIVYKKFEKEFENKQKSLNEFLIYCVVLWAVVWYAKGKDTSFEDFMFFSSVRL